MAGGTSAYEIGCVSTAAAVTTHSDTASRGRAPCLITLVPSQKPSVQSAIINASGFTLVEVNASPGNSPTIAAPASCGTRRRLSSSPTSSQVATTVKASTLTPQITIPQ